ncbi:XTP/dITP diphosphatase [Tissierella pigra]|uniref:dITP/XTP pyrophosphatase n=1 Tax=Tissierella pigra TaxID=2607614 RepID=A0A6N7XET3_9FIRM|nr:XTP/dITP diphosphatase [Tissierella pigra]MBU5427517.1 XTP/dITP diphosphatase [Tissierella pigra]MSU00266.1 XTP/dITP diphosphatase [Tissierella pigra]
MNKRKLVLSTGNKHKVEEIKNILKDLPIEVVTKHDVGLGDLEVVEDGNTLEENSIKKAKTLAEKLDYMVLADDSGLFVDILNGEPGVYSSRYAGEEGNDKKNNQKLLETLKDVPLENRTAKFEAVIALVTEDKELIVVKGQCKGTIGFKEEGNNDFGYDPLFTPNGYNKTFAELGEDIKNKISHRAKALDEMKKVIKEIIGVRLV